MFLYVCVTDQFTSVYTRFVFEKDVFEMRTVWQPLFKRKTYKMECYNVVQCSYLLYIVYNLIYNGIIPFLRSAREPLIQTIENKEDRERKRREHQKKIEELKKKYGVRDT